MVGMSGGHQELALGNMVGVMPVGMMVNDSTSNTMMGTMGPAHHTVYSSEAAQQTAYHPMISSPPVMGGTMQMAAHPPPAVIPSSHHHHQQMLVYQRSRTASTPHHHARAAIAQQRQQSSFYGGLDGAHVPAGTPVSNYADFLSGRSTTPLGHMNGHGSTPAIIRPPSTRAKSASIGSANDRKTPGPVAQTNGGIRKTSQWTELDMGGMNLRVVSSPLFKYSFLTKLYINHNQLSMLPVAISDLRCLEELDASGNLLTAVPAEVGMCCNLKELLLFDNQIADLPYELGTLFKLESLGLEGNPLQDDLRGLLQKEGTRMLIEYLRDNGPAPAPPPDRQWISLDKDVKTESPEILTVLNYNVLCPKYATPQMYSYCPSWALEWEYRRDLIMGELTTLQPDIVCLQEVEASQFEGFFRGRLRELGYEGVFWTKSRARTMSEEERKLVDGCATFYRSGTFKCVSTHLLEFQQSALGRKDFQKCDDFFNRFMTKDNIVGFAVLQHRQLKGGPLVFVANTHVHWDPEYTDVKMVQTAMLTEELAHLVGRHSGMPALGSVAIDEGRAVTQGETHRVQQQHQQLQRQFQRTAAIICGDFNSKPDSGLYEFLSRGRLDKEHKDLEKCEPYADYKRHGLRHPFKLKSGYASVGELPMTNFVPGFKATIDYIWYTTGTLVPTGILGEVKAAGAVGFPNPNVPSDHIPIMAEFRWEKL